MRYLFAPATAAFAAEYLAQPRRDGVCVCLGADVPFRSADTWDALRRRFPAGWEPDRVVLWLADAHVPDGLWAAPVPLVGLAANWDTLGHYYRHVLPLCDAILAPPPAAATLLAQGFVNVAVADLAGLGDSALATPRDDHPRELDVLVLDALTATHPLGREVWAGRVAQLGGVCRVAVRRPTTPEADRKLLAQARLVVQLPSVGGDDRPSYEALAAGALPLRPQCAWDGTNWLRPGVDFAAYDERNFEAVVLDLLRRDDDRRAMVRAGQARLREWLFAPRLDRALSGLDIDRAFLDERARRRSASGVTLGMGGRAWAALAGGPSVALPPPGSTEERPEAAVVRGVLAADAGEAVGHFRRALALEPAHPVARANLAEALAAANRNDEAVAAARVALDHLDRTAIRPAVGWDVPLYPPNDTTSAALWDAAAWSADAAAEADAKRGVLRWRLHALLAGVTGDLSHFHEAALHRPDLPSARAVLGCALARVGRPGEALSHLRAATTADPFDRPAAHALFAALADAGDPLGGRLFARAQRRLAAADPAGCPAEPWFADAGPVGDELASVVVVIDPDTPPRPALDAVLRHTRPPYELILVGDPATVGDELMAEYERRPGVAQFAALQVAAGLPFAERAARGMAAASGDFVVLLDGRAVVAAHWLDGLLGPLCDHWPRVAAVGPRLPGAAAPQASPQGDADGLAWTPRLAGTCLVTHRDLLERVGPLDPRFGGFAPDDWAARARRAGFALAVAGTVALTAVEAAASEADFEAFRAAWGPAEANAYRRTDAGWARRPTVSLCMIVRDEERYLADCLESVRDLVDEVVVVDTGSTDATQEVAARYGARVFDFPWVDDFAAARNASLRHASGDWVVWMDADDRLTGPARAAFRDLTAGLGFDPAAYVFKCVCVPDVPGDAATVVDHVRLFRHDPRLRWRYRVHEQILPALRAVGVPVRWAAVEVAHVGYAAPDARPAKRERDLRLLRLEEREQPDDPFTLFNLGSLLLEAGQPREALAYLSRSLAGSAPRDSIVRKLYALVARCHRQLGDDDNVARAVAAGRVHYPDDAELLTLAAEWHRDRGEWAAALPLWRALVEGRDGDHFASVSAGLRGAAARQGLAEALAELGQAPRPGDSG